MAGLTITTGPSIEPVTVDQLKDHLRISGTDEDTILGYYISAARLYCENFQGRSYITTVWKYTLDEFPDIIYVPRPPLQSSGLSIKYYDTNGVQQTLSSSVYQVDIQSEPGRIVEAYGQTWPSIRDMINAVELNFKAGYGDAAANVPENNKLAVKLLAGWYYENREDLETAGTKGITSVDSILWQDRRFNF